MREKEHAPEAQDSSGWQYKSDSTPVQSPVSSLPSPKAPASGSVSWTASEFIANQKSSIWYAYLGLAGAGGSILIYLLTKDVISAGMIIVAALIMAIFAARKPRVLSYRLDSGGISIGQKHYSYFNFKSFAVIDEGAVSSILFMPMKRFMPSITVYYDPKDEEPILGTLSNFLPFEQREHDAVDRFMKRIRF